MYDTQLSDFSNFDYDSIIFYKPEIIQSHEKKNNFKKIKIAVKNKDGSIGDLVFSTPKSLFSFGLQELKDSDNNINGYIMPITIWKKSTPINDEIQFQTVLQNIIEMAQQCAEHYVESKVDTKRFSPLSIRKNDDNDNDRSPILYCKLIYNKKENKISTIFIDESTNMELDPLSILGKKCYVTGAIEIDCIFIGEKITLQVKLYEAIIKTLKAPRKSLLLEKKNNQLKN